jgi:hypothetical protein
LKRACASGRTSIVSAPRSRITASASTACAICDWGGDAGDVEAARTIASTSRSLLSAATIERARTSAIASVTSSTLGSPSVRYQRFDGRIRLQPIV